MAKDTENDVQTFIERWDPSGGAERSNYQMFLSELCDLIAVARPNPAEPDNTKNNYVFDRAVVHHLADDTTTPNFIDLYKRNCFVLETKQGIEAKEANASISIKTKKIKKGHGVRGTRQWDTSMLKARGQAESYAKDLPVEHGWPPFLAVVDVGHCIELYADFSLQGKNYTQFPDTNSFRILLKDLAHDDIRDRLRALWTDPLSLDPSRRTETITREIANRLAILARSMEEDGQHPQKVARFLMRCLFTMFAEDVGLIPAGSYTELLKDLKGRAHDFHKYMEALWSVMNKGGFSPALGDDLARFNGGLFAEHTAIRLNEDQLELLIEAAEADWQDVEPAIFGSLLERALSKKERHTLGAHYTPREHVERLVIPTIIEPLREDWNTVKATALAFANGGKQEEALKIAKAFHQKLCDTRVLDPACGTGNFLYVAMEHMKRLEGEVVDLVRELGERHDYLDLDRHTVDPHQFLGIEINPRATAISELVLWIGYLQWHFRTRGKATRVEPPILKDYGNIECRDAILDWDKEELVCDEKGKPVTRWDGETMKTHPTTGKQVPDETAQIETYRYINPRPTEWPKTDFIIGNPPFLGGKDVRKVLGEGYASALWRVHKDLPNSIDFVMYWWNKAAVAVAAGNARRFGLITTKSLPQTFNRRVVEKHLSAKKPISLTFAIPNHPWVDTAESAAVRIAMTVGFKGARAGKLEEVINEKDIKDSGEHKIETRLKVGRIHSNLQIGADITQVTELRANTRLCRPGVKLHGAGFIVTPEKAKDLGLGSVPGLENHIRPYLNGRDLVGVSRDVMVIDLFGLHAEEVRDRFPSIYQHVLENVKPNRDQNNRKSYRDNWWIFGEPRKDLRLAIANLPRYLSTVETAKHRVFVFLDAAVLPDNMLVNIALDDAFCLAVLSSQIHTVWALAAGGRLGYGNDPRYTKTKCFDPFPFPESPEELRSRIRELGDALDRHRKNRRAEHSELTLTKIYNVFEKLRSGELLEKKDKAVHEKGLVSVLKEIHDQLDAAVFDAYGWPHDLSDDEILGRLVALNKERAEEEAGGLVRWLRPEYQAPEYEPPEQQFDMAEAGLVAPEEKAKKRPWPKPLPDQVQAVREALAAVERPVTAADVARDFKSARKAKIQEILETLTALGQARRVGDRFGT